MLRPYCGEYLVHPAPLHLDLNRCNNGCFYCFANLNKPERKADYQAIVKQLSGGAKGLAAWLLDHKYPILCSNTTDPFCATNEKSMRMLRPLIEARGHRLVYQTKGSKFAVEWMRDEQPTLIDITITGDDNDILRQAEPNAPTFEERMLLAEECKKRGHFVIVSMIPIVLSWWKDLPGMIARLKKAGIGHVWIETLHFSKHQLKLVPCGHRKTFAAAIEYGMKKAKPDASIIDKVIKDMTAAGINVYMEGASSLGNFWQPFFDDLGFPFFPTMDGWYSELNRRYPGEHVIYTPEIFNKWAAIPAAGTKTDFRNYLVVGGGLMAAKEQKYSAANLAEVNSHLLLHIGGATETRMTANVINSNGEILNDFIGYSPAMVPEILKED